MAGQAVLAGQIVSGNEVARTWHEANAYLVLLVALIRLTCATIIWRRRGPGWMALAVLSLVVAVMLQMQFGYAHKLTFHLPLGVAIFGLSVTLLWRAPGAALAG